MSYRLCLDLITNRVIYFTSDPTYESPDNGFVYTAEVDSLPDGFNLQTCWRHRFIGGALVYASTPQRNYQGGPSLVDGNRSAMCKALSQRLLAQWAKLQPWRQTPDCAKRSETFLALEEAFSTRIAAAATPEDFNGLALEISALEVQ